MEMQDLAIAPVKVTDLLTVTRMAHTNMVGADSRFTQLVSNPIYRWTSYLTLPLYFFLAGRGYKATYKGVIIGCAYIHIRAQSGFIFNVNVNKPYRRQGVGQHLMSHLEKVCQGEGRGWMALQVDAHNHAARKMYERLGFRTIIPCHLRWKGNAAVEYPQSDDIELESLPHYKGTPIFHRYRDLERSADLWPISLLEEYNAETIVPGLFYRCLIKGEERGCVWRSDTDDRIMLRLALDPTLWGTATAIALVVALMALLVGGQKLILDLHLSSNAHYQKMAPNLINLGFEERSHSRLLLAKSVVTK
jgi:ribosomal protein S18 acetylase RimI-like enzyme